MASTPRDQNRVPTLLGTSNADGKTVLSVYANASLHALKCENGTTGSGFPYVNAERDDNRVPALWAVSNADGVTPVPVYMNSSTKALLIDST